MQKGRRLFCGPFVFYGIEKPVLFKKSNVCIPSFLLYGASQETGFLLRTQKDDMSFNDDDIIIHPVKTKKDPDVPSFGLLFVNPGEAIHVIDSVVKDGGHRHFLHNSQLAITQDGTKFIAGPAIGAPAAVLALEKLIVLGAERIILMGWCGAIDKGHAIGDVIIPSSALCGEGTSRYYNNDIRSKPSGKIVEKLTALCVDNNIPHATGGIWSTDAPYRESRQFFRKIRKEEQVIGVDMEFSALCSVATYRQIDFAAIMVVSDELWGQSWQPGFKKPVFKTNCEILKDILVEMVW